MKYSKVFSDVEYRTVLKPDAELLKLGWPSPSPKFTNSNFWGPATGLGGASIQHGFKMKWHNFGNGKAFLCQGYVKDSDQKDKREMAKLKNRINDIANGTYEYRGLL